MMPYLNIKAYAAAMWMPRDFDLDRAGLQNGGEETGSFYHLPSDFKNLFLTNSGLRLYSCGSRPCPAAQAPLLEQFTLQIVA